MIQAVIFDLDGTLVNTESLKCRAYFEAIHRAAQGAARWEDVEAAYQAVVGRSRAEVAAFIVDRLGLDAILGERMRIEGLDHPWEVLVTLFADCYERLLADPETLRDSLILPVAAAAQQAALAGRRTALASMTSAGQAAQVLALSGLDRLHTFDVVLTREAVSRPKPDPEIYLLAASRLGIAPKACLVIEDTTVGVQAGLAAGMRVVGLATPLTARSLHTFPALPPEWIVDDLDELAGVVEKLLD